LTGSSERIDTPLIFIIYKYNYTDPNFLVRCIEIVRQRSEWNLGAYKSPHISSDLILLFREDYLFGDNYDSLL
jgi:hypothetical protein